MAVKNLEGGEHVNVVVKWYDKELIELLKDRTGKFAVDAARTIADHAKNDSNVPRRTGKMQDSITSDSEAIEFEPGKFGARAYTQGVFYSLFQHNGTPKLRGYPFMRLALDATRSTILERAKGMINR